MKNPLTPASFRFVAQYLNHCATAVPSRKNVQILRVAFTVTISSSRIQNVFCFHTLGFDI